MALVSSRSFLVATALLGSLLGAGNARATYSIIAVDVRTGEVGGAGTSCVGSFSVYAIYGAVPGTGVVAAQAALNMEARDRAVMLLDQGMSAADVIADISAESYDPLASVRQYAVIDVGSASAAGFTGAATMVFADDVQGSAAPYLYSVQGNILTSAAVLSQASAVFSAPGCDLADTLLLALEAGAENGEGDSRCTPEGIPSDGAFIEVNLPDQAGEPYLHLQADDTAPSNPLTELRAMYDAWRATHPCPEPASETDAGVAGVAVDAGVMPADAAVPDGGPVDVPGQPQTGGAMAPAAGSGGASGAGGMAVGGIGASGGGEPVPPATAAQPDKDSSGCAIAPRAPCRLHLVWLLATALYLARRRRSEPRA